MSATAGEKALQRARVAFARGDARRCRHHLDEGLTAVSGSGEPVEVALLVLAAQLSAWEFDPGTARAAAATALAAAQGARAFVPEAELVAGQALFLGGSRKCLTHAKRAAVGAAGVGDLDVAFEARSLEAAALQAFGEPAAAMACAGAVERDAAAAGKTLWASRARWTRARTEWLVGGAPGPAIESLRELARLHVGLHRPQLLADLALALADAGEAEQARRVMREAASLADTRWADSVAGFYRAEIEWTAGRSLRAVAAVDELVGRNPAPPTELMARNTRQWALFERGAAEPDPAVDRLQAMPMLRAARVENRAFGLLAAGEVAAAAEELERAAARWHGHIARNELRALWGAGKLLLGTRDRRAGGVLAAVEARAADVGLVAILGRVRACLRQLERAQRPRRRAPLSSRERQILELVGDSLTAKQIAAGLGISPRTVDSHIANAMWKLEAGTRGHAAALHRRSAGRPLLDLLPAEAKLLELLAAGSTVTDAAAALGISRRTATRLLLRVRRRNGAIGTAAAIGAMAASGRGGAV